MSNNSRVGGILSIVCGGIGILFALMMLLSFSMLTSTYDYSDYYDSGMTYAEFQNFQHFMSGFFVVMIVFGAIFSAVAIVGGIFALRKQAWGFALAGSIVSLLVFFPCGIPALIFTAMSKPEFDAARRPVAIQV